MTTSNDWADQASAFIDALTAERKADPKAFSKNLVGPKRAQAAIVGWHDTVAKRG